MNEPYIAAVAKVPVFREGQKKLKDFLNSVLFSEDTNFRKKTIIWRNLFLFSDSTMDGAFVNNNNLSFNQAQTVLNWDPSSLEIKTRTVEKTLEPLVLQVSIQIKYNGSNSFWSSIEVFMHLYFHTKKALIDFKISRLWLILKVALFWQLKAVSPHDLEALVQGQLQEWTEHSHTDLWKSETSRDIKKSF